MLEPSASRFWHVALQSGLISASELKKCWDSLPDEKRTADAIDRRLARQAVSLNKLTLWQAQQLLAGKSSGYRIDKYILLDRIGQGGMGRVYLAQDTRLDRKVALKVLSPERMNNPRAIARFRREAKVGAQLQDPNLVRIYDDGDAGGLKYLVMEYIDGKNLAKIISEDGPMEPSLAANLARQVALGLEHANQKGLIHRDVNPSNILVTVDGMAKLTDLGLAIDLADSADVTRDGATVGTFDYVSPEQARNSHGVDTRSDVYSLGCTLYHMLTAQVPFPCVSLPEKLYAHQLQEPPRPSSIVPTIPPALDEIVLKMMRKLPEERFQSPAEVAQALAMVARDDPTPFIRRKPADGSTPKPAAGQTDANRSALGYATPSPDGSKASKNDPFVTLPPIDLGLDDPLMTGLVQSKTKPAAKPKTSETKSVAPPKKTQSLAALIVGLGLLSAVLIGVWSIRDRLGLSNTSASTSGTNQATKEPGHAENDIRKSAVNEKEGESATLGSNDPKKVTGEPAKPFKPTENDSLGISVLTRSSGQTPAKDFRDAVQFANARDGDVVLSNSQPIRLTNAKSINSDKALLIRAAEGTNPVIEIDMTSQNPWLMARQGSSLTIQGVTIIAKFSNSNITSPLIQATGKLAIESCSFQNKSEVANTRVIRLEGRDATIKHSFFDGFNYSVDFLAGPNVSLTLKETIVANIDRSNQLLGWAIRAELKASGNTTTGKAGPANPHLKIERCTINTKGVVDLEGLGKDQTASRPLDVNMTETAVKSKALLGWPPPPVKLNLKNALNWTANRNRYDIVGQGPLVILHSLDLPVDPELKTYEKWNELVAGGRDKNAKFGPIEFATKVADLADLLKPVDFALSEADLQSAGADAGKVGAGAVKK